MTPHPLRLFFAAETGRSLPDGPATCWFCAGPCPEEGPRAVDVVRSTFSDMAKARAGGDGPVCEACVFYLDYKILRDGQKRGMGLYTKTVVVMDSPAEWAEWERATMLDDLLQHEQHGLPRSTYLTCNYSKQKHVLPWARLSSVGERCPWISTDAGDVRLIPDWPGLAWCVAWLWGRGHGKLGLVQGSLSAWCLARSDDVACDLAAANALRAHADSPLLEFLSYIVTEDNCDRASASLASRAAPLLRGALPRATSSRAARGDPQFRGGPRPQEPVSAAMVGHGAGPREAGSDDERQPDALEQFGLF